MPANNEAVKLAIKQATDIVALAGDYGLHVRPAGTKYKALCPFHDDHNPSLVLDPEHQSYKCWSCGAGGDVFSFVMNHDKVEFPEALRMLSERTGIALAPADDRERSAPKGPSKTDLLAVCAWAEEVFRKELGNSSEGRAYIEKRGLSAESVERFHLGVAPDSRDWLLGQCKRAGFSVALLEAAGLASRDEEKGLPKDRFRGRLIFPIHDLRGRPIAFGGRLLPDKQKKLVEAGLNVAKYLNSPETPLFHKRRQLYAANLARAAAKEAGWVAVVEGYTDVIAAHQVGLRNVVATLGTALGDDHVSALRGLADRVVLVFDGDEAGQKAADRSLELFLTHEVDVRVLTLPDDLDPCDFLLKEGAAPFRAMVEQAADPLQFAVDRAATRFDLDSPEGARQAAVWVLSLLGRMPGGGRGGLDLKVAKALDMLSRRLKVPVDDLRRELRQRRKSAVPRLASAVEADAATDIPESVPIRVSDLDPVERALVQCILNDPKEVRRVITRVAAPGLRDAPLRTILQASYDLFADGETPDFARLALRLGPAERVLAADLLLPTDASPLPEGLRPAPWGEQLTAVLQQIAVRDWHNRQRDLQAALAETDRATQPDEHRALVAEYSRLLSQRPDTRKTIAS